MPIDMKSRHTYLPFFLRFFLSSFPEIRKVLQIILLLQKLPNRTHQPSLKSQPNKHKQASSRTFSILDLAAISCNFRPCSFFLSAMRASSSSLFSSACAGSVKGNWMMCSCARSWRGSESVRRSAG